MDIFKTYDIAYNKYLKTLNDHNNALIKAISVSDSVSKEVFYQAYLSVYNKLQQEEADYKALEPILLKEIANELFNEYTNFYYQQFINCDLQSAFKSNNLDLQSLINLYRMRPINSLEQKRELCLLMNEMKRQIKLIDYEGKEIDLIGKYTDLNPILIRCRGFARFPDSIIYTPIKLRGTIK